MEEEKQDENDLNEGMESPKSEKSIGDELLGIEQAEMEEIIAKEKKEKRPESPVPDHAEDEMFTLFQFELSRIQAVLENVDKEFGKVESFADFSHFLNNFEKLFELNSICAEEICSQLHHIELECYSKVIRRIIHNYKHQITNLARVNISLQETANLGVNSAPVLARDYLPTKFSVDPMQEKFYFFRKMNGVVKDHKSNLAALSAKLDVPSSVLPDILTLQTGTYKFIEDVLVLTDFEDFSQKIEVEASEDEYNIKHRKAVDKETETYAGFVTKEDHKKVMNEVTRLQNIIRDQDQRLINASEAAENLRNELKEAKEATEKAKLEVAETKLRLKAETDLKLNSFSKEKMAEEQIKMWKEDMKTKNKDLADALKESGQLRDAVEEWRKRYEDKEEAFKRYVRKQHENHLNNDNELRGFKEKIKELEEQHQMEIIALKMESAKWQEKERRVNKKIRKKTKELSSYEREKVNTEKEIFELKEMVRKFQIKNRVQESEGKTEKGEEESKEKTSEKGDDNILEITKEQVEGKLEIARQKEKDLVALSEKINEIETQLERSVKKKEEAVKKQAKIEEETQMSQEKLKSEIKEANSSYDRSIRSITQEKDNENPVERFLRELQSLILTGKNYSLLVQARKAIDAILKRNEGKDKPKDSKSPREMPGSSRNKSDQNNQAGSRIQGNQSPLNNQRTNEGDLSAKSLSSSSTLGNPKNQRKSSRQLSPFSTPKTGKREIKNPTPQDTFSESFNVTGNFIGNNRPGSNLPSVRKSVKTAQTNPRKGKTDPGYKTAPYDSFKGAGKLKTLETPQANLTLTPRSMRSMISKESVQAIANSKEAIVSSKEVIVNSKEAISKISESKSNISNGEEAFGASEPPPAISEEAIADLLKILTGSQKNQENTQGSKKQATTLSLMDQVEQTKNILKNSALSENEKEQFIKAIMDMFERKRKLSGNTQEQFTNGNEIEQEKPMGQGSKTRTNGFSERRSSFKRKEQNHGIKTKSIHEGIKETLILKEEDLRELFAFGTGGNFNKRKSVADNKMPKVNKEGSDDFKEEKENKQSSSSKSPEKRPSAEKEPMEVCPFHFGLPFKGNEQIHEVEAELETDQNAENSGLKETYSLLRAKFYEDPKQFNMQFQFVHSLEAMKNYEKEFMSFREFKKYYRLFFQAHQEVCVNCANLGKFYSRLGNKKEEEKPLFPISKKTFTKIPVLSSDTKNVRGKLQS